MGVLYRWEFWLGFQLGFLLGIWQLLEMTNTPNHPSEEFATATNQWDLERLYSDLASAKKEVALSSRKGLTPAEKLHLRGLLCGYSPKEIAEKLYKQHRGVEADLSKTLYRYTEVLTNRELNTLKSWRDVVDWLAEAGYKIQQESSQQVAPPIQPTPSYMNFFVYDAQSWVGRQTLSNKLSNMLQGAHRLLLLVGITGIGKTALAEKLVEGLRGYSQHERRNFESQERGVDFVSVASEWLKKWGVNIPPNERQPKQLRKRLIVYLSNHKTLVLMDSIEHLLVGNEEDGWLDFEDREWSNFFVSFLSEPSCQSRIIITSQALPSFIETECDRYHEVWHQEVLHGLEASEQIAFWKKVGLDDDLELASSPLRLIGEVYDGHPLALRVIAGEIKERPNYGNVQAYWQENSHYIEEVKTALDKARSEAIVEGQEHRWQLASYTRDLKQKVRERVETTFQRLINDTYDAYFLLCAASVYCCEVPESWWLSNLEDEGYSEERQKVAMQALRDRYLVEDTGTNHEHERLVSQHNLIRSVAIAHRLKLPQN